MRALLFFTAIIAAVASPSLAARPSVARMVDDVRSEAAWHGVEVTGITRRGDSLLVQGTDRFGSPVVLHESCSNSRIDCLPDSPAGGSASNLRAPD